MARLKTVLWLDAAIGALALSAVSAGAVIEPVLATTGGSTAAVVTNLAYPVRDLLVLAMVVSVFAVSGWRPDRSWLVIGVAFCAQAGVDSVYLYQSTAGTWEPGTLLDLGWVLNVLLIGLAAWTRPWPVLAERRAEWLTMLMPPPLRSSRSLCSCTGHRRPTASRSPRPRSRPPRSWPPVSAAR